MSTSNEVRYLASHEWGRIDEEGILTVGISEHAQELLGDIVFVDLPDLGKSLNDEEESAIVESVKAA
jgi:glycine cleavage system H protein